MPKRKKSSKSSHSAITPITFDNADEASSLLSTAYAPVILEPIGKQPFNLTVAGVTLPGMQIYRSGSENGLRFSSVGYFDGFTFSSMRSGTALAVSNTGDHGFGPGATLVTDATMVDQLSFSKGSVFCGLALDATQLSSSLSARLDKHVSLRMSFEQGMPNAAHALCENLCDLIYAGLGEGGGLANNPLAVRNLQDAVINLVLSGTRHNYSEELLRAEVELPRVLRKAIDYMHANAHHPITTTDVAVEIGIGLRTLQLSFQRWFDTTPNLYMRAIRLKRAREELARGEGLKVGDVAQKWGFYSPGEFARLYQAAFGERPKDTFKR